MRKVSSLQISTGGQQWWRRGSKWEGATCGGGGRRTLWRRLWERSCQALARAEIHVGPPGTEPQPYTHCVHNSTPAAPPPRASGGHWGRGGALRADHACLPSRKKPGLLWEEIKGERGGESPSPKAQRTCLSGWRWEGGGKRRLGSSCRAPPPLLCFALLCFSQ